MHIMRRKKVCVCKHASSFTHQQQAPKITPTLEQARQTPPPRHHLCFAYSLRLTQQTSKQAKRMMKCVVVVLVLVAAVSQQALAASNMTDASGCVWEWQYTPCSKPCNGGTFTRYKQVGAFARVLGMICGGKIRSWLLLVHHRTSRRHSGMAQVAATVPCRPAYSPLRMLDVDSRP